MNYSMIQPEELRIGNYVLDQFDNLMQIEVIDTIYKEISSREEGEVPINCIFPIPLSEDILLRLGFEKQVYKGKDFIGNQIEVVEYFMHETSVRISLEDDCCEKGLHWLQNWYYFETLGKELTLKVI